jgi:hypothetical protein
VSRCTKYTYKLPCMIPNFLIYSAWNVVTLIKFSKSDKFASSCANCEWRCDSCLCLSEDAVLPIVDLLSMFISSYALSVVTVFVDVVVCFTLTRKLKPSLMRTQNKNEKTQQMISHDGFKGN